MKSAITYLGLALLPFVAGCGGGKSSPTAPSNNPPANTRVINVAGNLSFGDVAVGGQRELSYTITNSGNSVLTVSGTTLSGGLASQTLFSFTTGQIAAGASQPVTVRFSPTSGGTYSGTVTVNGDQTSGSNTIPISATANAPTFGGNWSGRYIVERCDGTGSNQDYFCSQRGAFPPGTDLPITLTLTQNGSSVSGTIALGQVVGVVNGVVNSSSTMVLQGSATGGTISLTLSSWSTTVSGTAMTGNFTYNAGLAGVPGVAVVVSRLSGVTRR